MSSGRENTASYENSIEVIPLMLNQNVEIKAAFKIPALTRCDACDLFRCLF